MIPAAIAASAIPAIGNAIDSGRASATSKWNTLATIQANKQEAELAYQRSQEMWHMQNAYNSPAEQMKRFGAAGLNPHLIYGQGNAGNAQGTPQYQPPNIQYRYQAPAYGGAVGSAIPDLMAVGTWMQNMRASEVDIQSKEMGMDKTAQMIAFLRERNPREIEKLDNLLSMFPYQESMGRSQMNMAGLKLGDMYEEFRNKWGYEKDGPMGDKFNYGPQGGGTKGIEFLRKLAEQKLKTAQASWTDYGITDPQSLMRMVLGGVMGMAGMTMRARGNVRAKRSAPSQIKTYYQGGKRRSQVVDFK